LARALALLWWPLVTLAVIATGNHYVFDVLAGLLVTGLAYAAGQCVRVPRMLAAVATSAA
jgi:PAP2 superfamily protein